MDLIDKTQSCMNCTYAIFDPLWGDYKCSKKERFCTGDELYRNNCDIYNRGKPSVSKERKDYEQSIEDE